ncbi:50S ribosomal protein L11-like [Hippocampus zosterae]|uniref:50S ribosomal protein L11-like n=1 Tax=Hippocampus zosterae TaxID=109293 RepID=UPI00223CFCE5|nr:50S ribosomal protein L11-like [Hippocampus zosterae]
MAGVAKPNPKMGQALGPLGINMMQFCKEFNARTSAIRNDVPLRVIVYSFTDRSYEMQIKPPETSWFLRKATGAEKFSMYPGRMFHTEVPYFYIVEIAKIKK